MVKRRGFTLVELLISASLGAVVLIFLGKLLVQMVGGSVKFEKKAQTATSLSQIAGHLQKYMATGDSRFYAFTGRGAAGDRILARFFIPLPGHCADLSTNNCQEDVAMLYVHYDKTTAPAVTAICALPDNRTILVDLSNVTYGTGEISQNPADGFNVLPSNDPLSPMPSGRIIVAANRLIALMNPPNSVLWVAADAPQKFPAGGNLTYNKLTRTFTPAIPDNCRNSLRPDPSDPQNFLLDKIYSVQIDPYRLSQFTKGLLVSGAERASSLGTFPARLYSASLRSIGKSFQGTEPLVGINNCNYVTALNRITCDGPSILSVPDAKTFRVDESFKLALGPNARLDRYEIRKTSMTPSNSCTLPNCGFLPMEKTDEIPANWSYSTPSEDFESINPAGFSLFKQDSLSRIRFRIINETREDYFDVFFP